MGIFTNNELPKETISFNGTTIDVYVRQLTAGERVKLMKGQRIKVTPGNKAGGEAGSASMEIDSGEQDRKTCEQVQMTICSNPEGDRLFRNIEAVLAEPAAVIKLLHRASEKYNRIEDDEADLGKS